MVCYISAVFAKIAFLPVPNSARILPSDGFGMSCCTRAERVKNLFLVDSWAAERAFYDRITKIVRVWTKEALYFLNLPST